MRIGFAALLTCAALPVPNAAALAQDSSPAALRDEAFQLVAGTDADKQKAIALFTQAAEAGDAASMAYLGGIYLKGDGVEANRQTAIDWYLKAVQAGHPSAAAKLAELAAMPAEQTTAPAAAPAVDAETAAKAEALFEQAEKAMESGDGPRSHQLYVDAAALGHVESMLWAGDLYDARFGLVEEPDLAKAYDYHRRAADAGDPRGMVEAGAVLRDGSVPGVAVDVAQADAYDAKVRAFIAATDVAANLETMSDLARRLIVREGTAAQQEAGKALARKVIELGDGRLAYIYAGTITDPAEQFRYFLLAAEAGNMGGMSRVAKAYETGLGTAVDTAKAIAWYERLAESGDSSAADAAKRLRAATTAAAAPVENPFGSARPVDDRWTAVTYQSRPAAAIASSGSTLTFACQNGGLSLHFAPAAPIDPSLAGDDMVRIVMDTDNTMMSVSIGSSQLWFAGPVADDFAQLASSANGVIRVGLGSDAPSGSAFETVNVIEFSARGSTAALKALKTKC